ncbi:MAG: nucleoside deaminase [Bacilli bacterium]|nr:nucleoside deaminase [Bacilli bacterium]
MYNYIDELLELANKAENGKDIPVGAIVVLNNKIIGRGYNNRVVTNDPTGHAEINSIKEASKYLNDWRLSDCDLYVTLEPCDMCLEVIKESRIKNVYYLLENKEKHKYKRTNVCIYNVDKKIVEQYQKKLSEFFNKNLNR